MVVDILWVSAVYDFNHLKNGGEVFDWSPLSSTALQAADFQRLFS